VIDVDHIKGKSLCPGIVKISPAAAAVSTVGANVGVSENPDRISEHERKENRHVQFKYTDDAKGDT
jgi:hypothetical protein